MHNPNWLSTQLDNRGGLLAVLQEVKKSLSRHQQVLRAVGAIASASLLATLVNLFGSLLQAHFVLPQDLGFVRKYSVVSGYAIFLNLGLFSILQREYSMLIGRGETDKAREVASIVKSWCLLSSALVSSVIVAIVGWELLHLHFRVAAAWMVQIVAVWSALYIGCLVYTFRSGHDFERLARAQGLSSIIGLAVLPVFVFLPFTGLILRSLAGPLLSGFYLHHIRTVRTPWHLPWVAFLALVKRGLRLEIGSYLRYGFWPTVEIWLLVRFGGDSAVGLFIFGKMVAEAMAQLATAANQVFLPRLAQNYGRTGSLVSCMRQSLAPSIITMGSAIPIVALAWYLLPLAVTHFFPKYMDATPAIRILALQVVIVSGSMPVQMVTILESYIVQIVAALLGLAVMVTLSFLLRTQGPVEAVAWGTVGGQAVFALTCYMQLLLKAKRERQTSSVLSVILPRD